MIRRTPTKVCKNIKNRKKIMMKDKVILKIEEYQIIKHFSTYVIIEYKNSLILVSIIPTNSILTSPVHWISLLANGATINPLRAVIELAIPIN